MPHTRKNLKVGENTSPSGNLKDDNAYNFQDDPDDDEENPDESKDEKRKSKIVLQESTRRHTTLEGFTLGGG